MRSRSVCLALLVMACSVSVFDYSMGRVGQPNRELLALRLQDHLAVVRGEGPDPYRYRVLAPLIIHAVTKPLTAFVSYDTAFHAVSAVFYFSALLLLLWVLETYLELWFTEEQALIGVLLVGCTLPITLRQ